MAVCASSVIVTGDTNLEKIKWNLPDVSLADMVDDTKIEIETENVYQLIN